ncbi:12194_t:CDS:1, partial [Gigaspora margarita]
NKQKTTLLKNKSNKVEDEAMFDYSNISEFTYNSLISFKNIDEFCENDNKELTINFNIELSSIIDVILNKDNENFIEQDKKLYLEIIQHIIKFIGYRWIYKNKNSKKNSLLTVYHCNCRIDQAKYQAKHPNSESQRDTSTRIEHYNCEGTIKVEVFVSLNLVKIKYLHLMLYSYPIHIATSIEICEFIKTNTNYLVSELYHQIKEKQLNGYENITIQQTYFWWFKESHKMYQHNSNTLILAKLLLAKLNKEIIIDLSTPIPALGFIIALFY